MSPFTARELFYDFMGGSKTGGPHHYEVQYISLKAFIYFASVKSLGFGSKLFIHGITAECL